MREYRNGSKPEAERDADLGQVGTAAGNVDLGLPRDPDRNPAPHVDLGLPRRRRTDEMGKQPGHTTGIETVDPEVAGGYTGDMAHKETA